VTSILLWKYIYSYTDGPLNRALISMGAGFLKQDWLGDPAVALGPSLRSDSVHRFLLVSHLSRGAPGISPSIYDATSMDGANAFQRITRVDMPILFPQFIVLIILSLIGSIQGFYNVMILTDGGPGFSTLVPGLVYVQVRVRLRAFRIRVGHLGDPVRHQSPSSPW